MEKLLQILACPVCRGPLESLFAVAGQEQGLPQGLSCPACDLVYPVRDFIPVLLVEEAIRRPDWDQGRR